MNQDQFKEEEEDIDLGQCLEILSSSGVPMPEYKLLVSTAAFLLIPESVPESKLPPDYLNICLNHVRDVHTWCWQASRFLDAMKPHVEVSQAFRKIGTGMLLSTVSPVRDFCFTIPIDPETQMTPEQIEEVVVRDNQSNALEKCFISISYTELMHFTKYVWEMELSERKMLLSRTVGSMWNQMNL